MAALPLLLPALTSRPQRWVAAPRGAAPWPCRGDSMGGGTLRVAPEAPRRCGTRRDACGGAPLAAVGACPGGAGGSAKVRDSSGCPWLRRRWEVGRWRRRPARCGTRRDACRRGGWRRGPARCGSRRDARRGRAGAGGAGGSARCGARRDACPGARGSLGGGAEVVPEAREVRADWVPRRRCCDALAAVRRCRGGAGGSARCGARRDALAVARALRWGPRCAHARTARQQREGRNEQ